MRDDIRRKSVPKHLTNNFEVLWLIGYVNGSGSSKVKPSDEPVSLLLEVSKQNVHSAVRWPCVLKVTIWWGLC